LIDLHTHLLPGIDDGPATMSEAVELARRVRADGARGVAATPHCNDRHPGVHPPELAGRAAELEHELRAHGIELGVVHGGEVDLTWGLEASDEQLHTVSYRGLGKDLLVETPYGPLTTNFEAMLFSIAVKGYRILLAHPERNPTFQEDPQRVERMSDSGTLLQVTASALTRPPRTSRSGKLARRLVEGGHAHVLASDSHGAAAPDRGGLSRGARVAAELVGQARAGWMVEGVPRAILLGEPLPEAPPIESRRGGRFARLRER
jgi:protein-tyrosine phosphatase